METPNNSECRSTITLRGGVEARLRSLATSSTYVGLLDGCPTPRINESLVEELRRPFPDWPARTVIRPLDHQVHHDGQGGAMWPGEVITATFRSRPLSPGATWSEATVVWFQAPGDVLYSPEILGQLGDTEWSDIAHDVVQDDWGWA